MVPSAPFGAGRSEVMMPRICGTPRIVNLLLRSSNPSVFSRINPNCRISFGFSKFSLRAGLSSATNRGSVKGSHSRRRNASKDLWTSPAKGPHGHPVPLATGRRASSGACLESSRWERPHAARKNRIEEPDRVRRMRTAAERRMNFAISDLLWGNEVDQTSAWPSWRDGGGRQSRRGSYVHWQHLNHVEVRPAQVTSGPLATSTRFVGGSAQKSSVLGDLAPVPTENDGPNRSTARALPPSLEEVVAPACPWFLDFFETNCGLAVSGGQVTRPK